MVGFQCVVDGSTGTGSIQQSQRQRLILHAAHSTPCPIHLEPAAQKHSIDRQYCCLGPSGLGRLLGCGDAREIHQQAVAPVDGLCAWRCRGAGSLCLRNSSDDYNWYLVGYVWNCTCGISVGVRLRAYRHDILAARMIDEHRLLESHVALLSFINYQSLRYTK